MHNVAQSPQVWSLEVSVYCERQLRLTHRYETAAREELLRTPSAIEIFEGVLVLTGTHPPNR